jgi:hypothetical protein
MTLSQALTELERARSDLRQVRASTSGWADVRRRRFDDQRLAPIEEAGARLAAALERAQEQFSAAQRLIG